MEGARQPVASTDYSKWALFAVLGLVSLFTLGYKELYLFDPHSPHWQLIAPFKWLLLPHAILGVTALVTGPLQFSSRIRRSNLALHRLTGRIYVSAVAIGAPIGAYIGFTFFPYPFNLEQLAQGGLWFLTTAIAYLAIRNKNVSLHRQWMARSYAFTFFFIASRIPFIFPAFSNIVLTTTVFWFLIVGTLIAPDLLLTWRQLIPWHRRS